LSQDESVHLSQEGAVAGSPLYMAPEQVMHTQPPDRRTDIYGLGSVAYFMLTGRPPCLGENAMAVMVAHARGPVTPPSQFRAEIPADLERVVLRCLAKKPADRYPDTPSLAQDLDACADAPNWSPRHAAEWWRAHPGPGPDETTARPVAMRDPLAEDDGEATTAMASVPEPRPM